jgi:hypothetical protein
MQKTDWKAAEHAASGLGIHTRQLVAARDADAVREWALRLASECTTFSSTHYAPRAASYLELAVLVGHVEPPEEPDKPEEVDDAA